MLVSNVLRALIIGIPMDRGEINVTEMMDSREITKASIPMPTLFPQRGENNYRCKGKDRRTHTEEPREA